MSNQKPIVIKIGTSSLTSRKPGEDINLEILNSIAALIKDLHEQGQQVVVVSSGAMGLGISRLGADFIAQKYTNGDSYQLTSYKQALTAIGQVELMNAYENIFRHYGFHAGQVLVTHKGLSDEERKEQIQNTIARLFEMNVVPVINENDTVASVEIEFGDNDRLSAMIASAIGAERLFILTDTDGLCDKDPHSNPDAKVIHEINEITDEIREIAGDSSTQAGMGGMKSKVMAAEICMTAGLKMTIINMNKINEIPAICSGRENKIGTTFNNL